MTPQELKASVLLLAMQGKVTQQLSSDGDAKDLMRYLHVDKKIIPADPPFDIPDNWAWIPVGYLGASSDTDSFCDGPFGSNLKTTHQISRPEVRIIQLSNIGEDGWKDKNVKYTSYKHLEEVIPRCEVFPGNLVIAKMMPAGRTIEVPELGTRITLGSDAMKFVPNPILNKKFLLFAMRSQAFLGQVYAEAHGITRVRTTLNGVKSYVLPIPPVEEQQRIVAKLEEVLPLINRYEAAWNKLEEFNKRFPGDMQKSILQLAIQGKLVEQRPEEGTGEELFQQIHAKKQTLIKAGKIKKEKPLPKIADDEIPFDIPEGWEWVRFAELMDSMSTGPFGSMLHKSGYVPKGIPLVNPANIVKGSIVASDKMMVSSETAKRLESYVLRTGMIIMGRRGEMGRCAVVSEKENGWLCGTGSFFMMPSSCVFVHCLSMFFSTPYAKTYLSGASVGTTMSNLNHKILSNMPVPLPPLAEQRRIVAKLKEILPLCERLK